MARGVTGVELVKSGCSPEVRVSGDQLGWKVLEGSRLHFRQAQRAARWRSQRQTVRPGGAPEGAGHEGASNATFGSWNFR